MRNLADRWRAQAIMATVADYRRSMVLDAIAIVGIAAYVAMSYRGPPPVWATILFLAGCIAAGIAAYFRRSYFMLICLLPMAWVVVEQLVSGTWIIR